MQYFQTILLVFCDYLGLTQDRGTDSKFTRLRNIGILVDKNRGSCKWDKEYNAAFDKLDAHEINVQLLQLRNDKQE